MSDGSVTIEVTLTKQQLEKGLKSLKSTINNTLPKASSVLDSFAKGFEKLGNLATSAGKACSVVTASVVGVFTAAATKAKSFIGTYESAMAVFNKKLQGGAKASKELYNSLLTIAKGSSFAQENLVSAGQTLVAMGVDADKTTKYAQIATNAIAGMGGTGNDIEALTEVFGKMAMQTNVYTDDLNQLAMKGIPVFDILATKYGVTKDKVKDMASKGLLPATETLETFTEALNTTDKSSKYFQYSISGMAQSLKSGTLTGAMDSLNSSFRTFALNLLGLDPRTESGKKNINGLIQVCQTFGAILEDVGDRFSFVGDWISSFINNLATVTEITDESGNTIKVYGGILGELKNKLDSLSPEQLQSIAKTILGLAGAGPILLAVGKGFNIISSTFGGLSSVANGIGIISKAIGVFKGTTTSSVTSVNMLAKAFSFLTGPVGIAIAVIGAVIALLVLLYKKSETFRNSVNKAFEQIKNALMRAWKKIKPALEKLGEAFGKLLESLGPVGEFLINVLGVAFEVLGNVLAFIIDIVADVITVFIELVTNIIVFFTDTIPNVWKTFIKDLQELVSNVWKTLVNAWNNIVSFFTETIPNAFISLLNKVSEICNNIKLAFQYLWNSIISFFTQTIPQWINNVISWFAQLPYMIGYQIGQVLGNIVKFGLSVWEWITVDLPQIIQGIIDWFAQLPDKIGEYLANTYNNVVQWGTEVYNSATKWISDTVNGIIEWFVQLHLKIAEFLINIINNIITWGQNTYNTAVSWMSNTVNGIIEWFKQLPRKNVDMASKYN